MSVIAGVLLSLLVIALLGILIGVLIVRAVYRSIRRNRTINGAVLRTRTAFTWEPQQQVLRLRMRLNDSLESGRAAVELTLRSDGLRGELVRLFKRIQAEGSTLVSTPATPYRSVGPCSGGGLTRKNRVRHSRYASPIATQRPPTIIALGSRLNQSATLMTTPSPGSTR